MRHKILIWIPFIRRLCIHVCKGMGIHSYLSKPKGATGKKFGKHWNRRLVRYSFGAFPPEGCTFQLMKCCSRQNLNGIFENSKAICSVWYICFTACPCTFFRCKITLIYIKGRHVWTRLSSLSAVGEHSSYINRRGKEEGKTSKRQCGM